MFDGGIELSLACLYPTADIPCGGYIGIEGESAAN
jgi:hypothetical protein